MREIGSEFWLDRTPTINDEKIPDWLRVGEDQCLLLSGRTSIDYVLEDITSNIRNVYMPSYCCESMLQPFLEKNIHVEYYDVVFNNDEGIKYIIDFNKECDVFFATSYFGFSNTTMDFAIDFFSRKNVIVIEDITHRLLNEQMYNNNSHYCIASLRKWFSIPSGGIAIKNSGKFSTQQLKSSEKLVKTKIIAMKQKEKYIRDGMNKNELIRINDKAQFLKLFSEFNDNLKYNYQKMEIDKLSKGILLTYDIKEIRQKRCENAYVLYEATKEQKLIKPMFGRNDQVRDCPLYFPIRVNPGIRMRLRKYLIDNEIYCPIHWPIPNQRFLNSKTRKIYDEELSLICDQRYDINDMKVVIDKIREFG